MSVEDFEQKDNHMYRRDSQTIHDTLNFLNLFFKESHQYGTPTHK